MKTANVFLTVAIIFFASTTAFGFGPEAGSPIKIYGFGEKTTDIQWYGGAMTQCKVVISEIEWIEPTNGGHLIVTGPLNKKLIELKAECSTKARFTVKCPTQHISGLHIESDGVRFEVLSGIAYIHLTYPTECK